MRLGTFIATLAIVFVAGVKLPPPPNTPVCHAVTEDSPITDCDYRNGTWYTK